MLKILDCVKCVFLFFDWVLWIGLTFRFLKDDDYCHDYESYRDAKKSKRGCVNREMFYPKDKTISNSFCPPMCITPFISAWIVNYSQ